MTTDISTFVMIIAACAIAWPVLMLVLARAAQSARLEMAMLEKELLRSEDVPQKLKARIRSFADLAFDWRPQLVLAFAAPVLVPFVVLTRAHKKQPKIAHAQTREKFDRFCSLSVWSDFAANPLAMTVVFVWFGMLALVLWPMGRLKLSRRLMLTTAEESDKIFCHNH